MIRVVLLGLLAIAARAGELREWTGARGLTVTGEFVELKANQVVVRTAEGKLIELPLMQLSTQDQLHARKLAMQRQTPAGRGSQPSAVQTNFLPYLTTGKYAGQHAYYEHPNLDLIVATNGFMTIHPKMNGQRIGPPLSCQWSLAYYPAAGHPGIHRHVQYYVEPPKPGLIRDRLTYRGIADDNVRFKMEISTQNNAVDVEMEYREPAGTTYPGYMGVGVSVPATHSFPEGTPLEKIAKDLAGYTLEFKEFKGRSTQYRYHQHVSLTNYIESAQIVGPWGPRRVSIRQRNTFVNIINYTATALYVGYGMGKYLYTNTADQPLRITVE